jgi:hypothetical protein
MIPWNTLASLLRELLKLLFLIHDALAANVLDEPARTLNMNGNDI